MKKPKHHINDIISELKRLDKKVYLDSLLLTMKISVNEEELAYYTGLWKKRVMDQDADLWHEIRNEVNILRAYFKEKDLEQFFEIERNLPPKDNNSLNNIYIAFFVVFGVVLVIAGFFYEISGNVEVSVNLAKMQFTLKSGLTMMLFGFIFLYIVIEYFRHKKRIKKFHLFISDQQNQIK